MDIKYDEDFFKLKFPKLNEQTISLFADIASNKVVSKQRKKKSQNDEPINIDIKKGILLSSLINERNI